jgi:hypothetical protein
VQQLLQQATGLLMLQLIPVGMQPGHTGVQPAEAVHAPLMQHVPAAHLLLTLPQAKQLLLCAFATRVTAVEKSAKPTARKTSDTACRRLKARERSLHNWSKVICLGSLP